MTSLTYSPLDMEEKEIRLLRLLPGRWTDPIACELSTISLRGNPCYDALSYVWGDLKDTLPITVDGKLLQATKSVRSALRRLRSYHNSRTLWVDAICINQEDQEEKTQQVMLMRYIYSNAKSVQIYLGEGPVPDAIPLEEQATWNQPPQIHWHRDLTVLLMSAEQAHWTVVLPEGGIKDQSRIDAFFARQKDPEYDPAKLTVLEALRDNQAGAFSIMNMLSNGRCLKECLHSDHSSPAWVGALDALNDLVSLPWWTRVWVLQEAILCMGEVTAIYGEIRAPLGLMEDSGSMLPKHHDKGVCCKAFWEDLPPRQKDILNRFATRMYALEDIRDLWFNINEDQLKMLAIFLQRTRGRKATDVRDKIYGLLGLIHHLPNPLNLRPDYRRTAVQVYTDIAMRIIEDTDDLSVLVSHEHKDLSSGLPTWVPNWTSSGSNQKPNSDYLIEAFISQFRAGLSKRWTARLVDGYALEVTGLEVDTVSQLATPLYPTQTDLNERFAEFEQIAGLTGDPFGSYKGNIPLFDAFWRTMLGDVVYMIDRENIEERIIFIRANQSDGLSFQIARAVWKGDPDNMLFLSPAGKPLSTKDIAYIANRVKDNFWLTHKNRVFFKTRKGYIGFGPPETRIGDRVCVILGSSVPLVMRPARAPKFPSFLSGTISRDSPCFTLVGYSYVHGIMDGEAVLKYYEEKDSISQTFARMLGKKDSLRKIYLL